MQPCLIINLFYWFVKRKINLEEKDADIDKRGVWDNFRTFLVQNPQFAASNIVDI